MPKSISELEKSLGKLISAIQKEWGEQLGETHAAELTENTMDSVHRLLQTKTIDGVKSLLGPLTVKQYIGDVWIQAHPNIKAAVERLENALADQNSD